MCVHIYAVMKTMYPPGYHHNGFMATHALGHRMYGYTLLYIYTHIYIYLYIYIYIYMYIHKNICSQKDRQCALPVNTNAPMTPL